MSINPNYLLSFAKSNASQRPTLATQKLNRPPQFEGNSNNLPDLGVATFKYPSDSEDAGVGPEILAITMKAPSDSEDGGIGIGELPKNVAQTLKYPSDSEDAGGGPNIIKNTLQLEGIGQNWESHFMRNLDDTASLFNRFRNFG